VIPTADPPPNGAPAQPIRVLLIDDDPVNATMAKSLLEHNGCAVQLASNPVKALEGYARKKDSIDLIIVDYFMPSLNGGETVQHLRALNPNIKVLLFSGAEEMRLRQIVQTNRIDGYIHKPLRIHEALEAIRNVLPPSSSN
jgi:CheY-like chemotaxis protein